MGLEKRMIMRGTLISYSPDAQAGVIKSESGHMYYFALSEWRADIAPLCGQEVTFSPFESVSKAIYLHYSNRIPKRVVD
jgi:hypothetical protein